MTPYTAAVRSCSVVHVEASNIINVTMWCSKMLNVHNHDLGWVD